MRNCGRSTSWWIIQITTTCTYVCMYEIKFRKLWWGKVGWLTKLYLPEHTWVGEMLEHIWVGERYSNTHGWGDTQTHMGGVDTNLNTCSSNWVFLEDMNCESPSDHVGKDTQTSFNTYVRRYVRGQERGTVCYCAFYNHCVSSAGPPVHTAHITISTGTHCEYVHTVCTVFQVTNTYICVYLI